MSRLLSKRAQSIAEYATLIAIVIGVAVGVKIFVQRAIQARQHDAAKEYLTAIGVDVSSDADMQAEMYTSQTYTSSRSKSDSSKHIDESGSARYTSSSEFSSHGNEVTLSADDYDSFSDIYE